MGHYLAELGTVQFFLPAADHDGGDTISDHIGEGATFAHKLVDADEKGQRLNRDGRDGGEDGGEGDEAGAGDDEEFVLNIGDKAKNGKAGETRNSAKNDDDEDQAGSVEGADQFKEIRKRGDAVTGHREGHAAESAERGGADDDTDDVENDLAKDDDAAGERIAASAQQRDGKAGKNGDEQNLENVAGGEGVNEGARDDGEQEGDDTDLLDSAGIAGGRFGIE